MNLYEGMFLLDNNVVREDWNNAKGAATGILEKHGANVATARRWAERSLAYTIKKRNRGTYLLVHFDADPNSISIVRRDLDLTETVMRYLILKTDEVPEGEQELHEAELSSDFSVPEPPEDHVVDDDGDEEEEGAPRAGSSEGGSGEQPASKEAKPADAEAPAAEEAKADEAEAPAAEEAKADEAEAPAAEEAKADEAEAPAAEATESTEEQPEAKASEEG